MLGGFGYYMHNPKALYNGKWTALQPLKTEGVGYPLSGVSTILGFGMDFTIDRNYKIGFKMAVHTTQSDYLDDISTDYPVPNTFPKTAEGQKALDLSYRGWEIDQSRPRPTLGDTKQPAYIRGNPKYDDSYIFATLNFAYVFKGKGQPYKREFHNGYVRKKGKRLGVSRFFAF